MIQKKKFTNDIDYENMLKSETSMRLDKKDHTKQKIFRVCN